MAQDFRDKPFGGGGELLAAPAAPASPPPQPPAIPAPPWAGEPALGPPPAASPPGNPVAEMLITDNGFDPAPPPGPAEQTKPLVPVELPPVDWRAEEAQRRAAEAQAEVEPELPLKYPAQKAKRAKTPRLDSARAVQAQLRALAKKAAP